VAVGAAGLLAGRLALGGVGLLHVLPGSPGSAVLGEHAQPVIFLAALAESTAVLGLLLPGAGVAALAGAGARAAGLPLPLLPVLVLLGAAGLLAGAVVNFQLGRLGLARLLRQPWTGAWGSRVAAQLAAATPLLRRHGWWVALVASAFGATRSSLAVAAGAGGFPLRRLLAIQLPVALLWSGLYAGGGYALADLWGWLEQAVRQAGAAGAGAAVLGAGAWWAARRWRRGRSRRPRLQPARPGRLAPPQARRAGQRVLLRSTPVAARAPRGGEAPAPEAPPHPRQRPSRWLPALVFTPGSVGWAA
jgi:membrane protein DedA with SNARE-associated domain